MFQIGCHLSAAKGFLQMGREAISIKANTFQFFTRNPRGGNAKELDPRDVAEFLALAKANGIHQILAHAPYTLNACAANPSIRDFTHRTMLDDLARLESVPGNLYNFHPGSHVGQGTEKGIELIAETLNGVLSKSLRTTVLLETMSGKGSEVGRSFEELRAILDRVELSEKMGVCLDTCHVYDAGYDIVHDLDGVLARFDTIIGLNRLKAIHLNDSKNPFSSHKDRHELLGQGSLGMRTFERIINHPSLRHLPFYLETPNDLPGYGQEIATLKSLRQGDA
ncbi:MAG: deoxyribonuclease IV [Myxococcales bacterium]|jgi:deoxyribonuclease-4|nr:deoxyribonuclease IV [Myxococcales bacterium]